MKKVREKLNAKLRKSGGFTLVEMLIVVAIIAILIAVSIPLVSSALDKAREATDNANERSALSVGTIYYLSHPEVDFSTEQKFYYAVDGSHEGSLTAGAAPTDTKGYGVSSDHKGQYVTVTIKDTDTDGNKLDTGIVVTAWTTN